MDPNVDGSFGPISPALRRTDLPCESCGGTYDVTKGRVVHKILTARPDDQQIAEWISDSVCEATDGCEVEPDGRCEHGHRSWLLALGMI
jgi:hypothetical protein